MPPDARGHRGALVAWPGRAAVTLGDPEHGHSVGQAAVLDPKREAHVEPMTGIEPAYSAWEADVLPLNYIGLFEREG